MIDIIDQSVTLSGRQECAGHNDVIFALQHAQQDFVFLHILLFIDGKYLLQIKDKITILDGIIQSRNPIKLALAQVVNRVILMMQVEPVAAVLLGGIAGDIRVTVGEGGFWTLNLDSMRQAG